ncbi:50S ribosomal protein L17 [Myxococcota bacterium]|nr:50S ribosomal protein L17 [Myxococcota bacterium]MCZ7619500.1 50S ribosomal protein L17 [Myxococcota bacterium]
MRHRWSGRKLGRTSAHRQALLRNLVTALLEHETIETTDAKAKEVRRVAERMITLGKRGDLHARRMALRVVRTKEVTTKLFDELAPRFRERPGGYTRVLKVRRRVGDAAPMSMVELVDREQKGGSSAGARSEPKAGRTKGKGSAAPADGTSKPRRGGRAAAAGSAGAAKPTRARRAKV